MEKKNHLAKKNLANNSVARSNSETIHSLLIYLRLVLVLMLALGLALALVL